LDVLGARLRADHRRLHQSPPSHLKLSKFAKQLDDGKCAYSWYEGAQDGAGADESSVDGEGDAGGAGLTSHL
jgi:hypothetical protein